MPFIPASRDEKAIKIHQDIPKLWPQMYCHLFMVHSVCGPSYSYSCILYLAMAYDARRQLQPPGRRG